MEKISMGHDRGMAKLGMGYSKDVAQVHVGRKGLAKGRVRIAKEWQKLV
jgi:hypothetical protein